MSVAVMFPGQGAQKIGMCQDFYEESPIVRDTFLEAEEVLDLPLRELCFSGPKEKLDLTEFTQPCLVTCEVAMHRLLASMGVQADMTAGFSLGEWAALIAADAIPFKQGLRLVRERARLMQSAVPSGEGGMLAVLKQEEAAVRALCEDVGQNIWMANFNCPGQIVCAGRTQALNKAEKLAAERGIMCVRLAVSIPSHCPLMEQAAEGLSKAIENIVFDRPRFPVVMNADGALTYEPEEIKKKLVLQLTKPVLYEKSVNVMAEHGADVYIEAGPGKTLAGFVKRTVKKTYIATMESMADIENIQKACGIG